MRRVALVLALLVAACTNDGADDPAPDVAAARMPVPRTEVAGGSIGPSEIIVVGGLLEDGTASPRADFYDASANRWRRAPDLPIPLHHSAVTTVGDDVFVVGGYTMNGTTWVETDRVFVLTRDATAWTEAPRLPAPRAAHAVAQNDDGEIVAIGGVSGGQVTASTAVYNPTTGWRAGPVLAQPREHLAAATHDGRIYAIAGRVGGNNFASVEVWDGGASGWQPAPLLTRSRGGIAADVVDRANDGRVCVAGGEETAGTIAPVECLDDGRWRVVGDLRVPRHGLAVIALGSDLHVIGGGDKPGLYVTSEHEVLAL